MGAQISCCIPVHGTEVEAFDVKATFEESVLGDSNHDDGKLQIQKTVELSVSLERVSVVSPSAVSTIAPSDMCSFGDLDHRSPIDDSGSLKDSKASLLLHRLATMSTKSSLSTVEHVENFIDATDDILLVDTLLNELHEVDAQEWATVLKSSSFERFTRKLGFFHRVGQLCCMDDREWFSIYTEKVTGNSIQGFLDPQNNRILHYRVSAQIPTSLTNVMAVANEVELLPTWNSLVVGQPQVVGQRSALHLVLHYKVSVLHGMHKMDILNEIHRFADPEGGFLVEYIESVDKDHSCYREPAPGFKRPHCKLQNIWVACGQSHTMLLQVGEVRLPFPVNKFLISNLGSLAGSFVLGGFVKNSLRSSEPGNPWEELISRDSLGLYAKLRHCVDSEESSTRSPRGDARFFGHHSERLKSFFERRKTNVGQDVSSV